MRKFVFCSKIQEDTLIPESGYVRCYFDKKMRVPVFRNASGFLGRIANRYAIGLEAMEIRFLLCVFYEKLQFYLQTRCAMAMIFIKNHQKNSRFDCFYPLILVTKGGAMINNMVLSREIEWIGYEHKRNMLQVEFIVGSVYQYENVPETVYQEFLTAPSHGRFFESNIKNKYHVRKVR